MEVLAQRTKFQAKGEIKQNRYEIYEEASRKKSLGNTGNKGRTEWRITVAMFYRRNQGCLKTVWQVTATITRSEFKWASFYLSLNSGTKSKDCSLEYTQTHRQHSYTHRISHIPATFLVVNSHLQAVHKITRKTVRNYGVSFVITA